MYQQFDVGMVMISQANPPLTRNAKIYLAYLATQDKICSTLYALPVEPEKV